MEVKIGMSDSPRELVVNSSETAEEVEQQVRTAMQDGSDGPAVLSLSDERGRKYLVNAARINYVEIGTTDARRVGFGK